MTACGCVFKEITLVGSNQGNFLENATACSKRMRKTTVATQLKLQLLTIKLTEASIYFIMKLLSKYWIACVTKESLSLFIII